MRLLLSMTPLLRVCLWTCQYVVGCTLVLRLTKTVQSLHFRCRWRLMRRGSRGDPADKKHQSVTVPSTTGKTIQTHSYGGRALCVLMRISQARSSAFASLWAWPCSSIVASDSARTGASYPVWKRSRWTSNSQRESRGSQEHTRLRRRLQACLPRETKTKQNTEGPGALIEKSKSAPGR